jgi:thiol-disulfide isomerase/thioredoxin
VTARRRLLVAGTLLGLVALAIGFAIGTRDRDARSGAGATDAAALLAVALPDLQGREQALGQWKGKVLIVNFWATWCAPCREEMPAFVRIQADLGPKGVQFVGIAVDQADKVAQFAAELALNYPALIGGYGAMELSKALGNRLMALPFTLVIDRSGTVVNVRLGPFKEAELRAIVGQLL